MSSTSKHATPLFVRIPQAQARALDRLAFESGRPKQALVSEMLAAHLGEVSERRVTIAPAQGETVLGRHAFRSHEPDVLTLEEVADLLSVDAEAVERLAHSGELPGRRIGDRWRFARRAVLEWLAAGSPGAAGE